MRTHRQNVVCDDHHGYHNRWYIIASSPLPRGEGSAYEVSVAILILPLHPIYHLQLALQTRLKLYGIFLLGGFVVVAGIFRAVYTHQGLELTPDDSCKSPFLNVSTSVCTEH